MKRLRIGIDARFITRQPRRGIGNYSLNLLRALAKTDQSIDFVVYISYPDLEDIIPRAFNIEIRNLGRLPYPFWEQIVLPIAAYRDKLDVLHSLGNTAPIWLPRNTRLVLSLMDVMFLQTNEQVPMPTNFYQRLGRLYRSWVAPQAARMSDQLITISEFSKQDILGLIPGIEPNKISSIHLSCDQSYTEKWVLADDMPSTPFLLCLGAEDPRKNTILIVEAYLRALKLGELEHNLVVCGYANWSGSPAHRLVQAAGADDRVQFCSFIDGDALSKLYCGATALLYISLYEGFGFPVLEAFNCGCPVIASNTTSIPEVAGDAAIYVDPTDVLAVTEAIVLICKDRDLRQVLKGRGISQSQQFDWARTADKTLDVYREAIQQSSSLDV